MTIVAGGAADVQAIDTVYGRSAGIRDVPRGECRGEQRHGVNLAVGTVAALRCTPWIDVTAVRTSGDLAVGRDELLQAGIVVGAPPLTRLDSGMTFNVVPRQLPDELKLFVPMSTALSSSASVG